MKSAQKNILVSPLDWGLGHASRLIPIINELNKQNHNVIIAGSGKSFDLLKYEFPNLQSIFLKSFTIKYSSSNSQIIPIFLQIPKFIYYTFIEYFKLKEIVKSHKIDFIISDNRFGLRNKNCKSAILTHQLKIKIPKSIKILERFINKLNRLLINKFDYCLIPDYENGIKISFDLSNIKGINNPIFIGYLSKFNKLQVKTDFKYEFITILSGPEPQRSILEKILISEIEKLNLKSILVRGSNKFANHKDSKFITFYDILESKKLYNLIFESKYIICRSGYSSIMDIIALNKKAIMIPTPGQTEQEYLAEKFFANNWIYSVKQSEINMIKAIELLNNYNLPSELIADKILSAKIKEILK